MDHQDHMKHLREQSPSDGPFVALDWRDGGIASFFRGSKQWAITFATPVVPSGVIE